MQPHRVPPHLREADKRRHYFRDNGFEFLIGILAALSGLGFFVSPESANQTAAGQSLYGLVDDLWYSAYVIGGLLICYGIARFKREAELAGLWLLAGAILVNFVGVAAVRDPGVVLFSSMTLGLAGYFCVIKARLLMAYARAAAGEEPKPGLMWKIRRRLSRRRPRKTRPGGPTGRDELLSIAPVALVALLASATIDFNAIAGLVLGGSFITALVAYLNYRAKKPTMTQRPLIESVGALEDAVVGLREENGRLRSLISEAEEKITTLEVHIDELLTELRKRPAPPEPGVGSIA